MLNWHHLKEILRIRIRIKIEEGNKERERERERKREREREREQERQTAISPSLYHVGVKFYRLAFSLITFETCWARPRHYCSLHSSGKACRVSNLIPLLVARARAHMMDTVRSYCVHPTGGNDKCT